MSDKKTSHVVVIQTPKAKIHKGSFLTHSFWVSNMEFVVSRFSGKTDEALLFRRDENRTVGINEIYVPVNFIDGEIPAGLDDALGSVSYTICTVDANEGNVLDPDGVVVCRTKWKPEEVKAPARRVFSWS